MNVNTQKEIIETAKYYESNYDQGVAMRKFLYYIYYLVKDEIKEKPRSVSIKIKNWK